MATRNNDQAMLHASPNWKLVIALAMAVVLESSTNAHALTPKDPQVMAVVNKALAYLEDKTHDQLGGKCLIGLCFLKNERDVSHPRIAAAVSACGSANLSHKSTDNYSLGIALVFLCEVASHEGVNPRDYDALIDAYLAEMLRRQKPNGAWGYELEILGDTSQTQYAVLGMWIAQNSANRQIPIQVQEAALGWLMRTQDASGGWRYKGVDAGSKLDPQDIVTLSRAAAGAGSAYMMADLLQVNFQDQAKSGKSSALKVADKGKAKLSPLTESLQVPEIKRTLTAGDAWFGKNYDIKAAAWQYYYMYALERYKSFWEKSRGIEEADPKWYQDGFNFLKGTQASDGHWDADFGGPEVTTCFAVLFLSRSAKKTIVKASQGVAQGGMGLPPDVKNLQEKNGRIVQETLDVDINQFLSIANSDGDNAELARLNDQAEPIKLSTDETKRNSELENLRKLVSAGKYESRKIAVRTLSKVRDLDNVPVLLYALTDPDSRIVTEADRGLRFISRKVSGVGLPDDQPSKQQIQSAQAAWKAWYLSVRPGAELLD